MFKGALDVIDVPIINHPFREQRAAYKPFQLSAARRAGLAIPRTLMSNDPAAIRAFWDSVHGRCIYKPFTAPFWTMSETRPLTPEDLDDLDTLRHAPIIVQQKIERGLDVRVNIFGDVVFAAAVETHVAEAALDWRMDLTATWREHHLPDNVAASLERLPGPTWACNTDASTCGSSPTARKLPQTGKKSDDAPFALSEVESCGLYQLGLAAACGSNKTCAGEECSYSDLGHKKFDFLEFRSASQKRLARIALGHGNLPYQRLIQPLPPPTRRLIHPPPPTTPLRLIQLPPPTTPLRLIHPPPPPTPPRLIQLPTQEVSQVPPVTAKITAPDHFPTLRRNKRRLSDSLFSAGPFSSLDDTLLIRETFRRSICFLSLRACAARQRREMHGGDPPIASILSRRSAKC